MFLLFTSRVAPPVARDRRRRSQVPWGPMGLDEAQAVLEKASGGVTTNEAGMAKLLEAYLVATGAHPDRIKTAVESFLGRDLDP
jgi:hypothetical protein